MTYHPAQTLTIEIEQAGQRIDNFLFTYLKSIPKTKIYRILRKGEVRVNSGRIQASYRLQAGDLVRLPPLTIAEIPVGAGQAPPAGLLKTLASRILYEDKGLLILNKPAGMAVHGGSGVSLGIIETLRKLYPKERYLELAHRLDRDTSGCLIITKKPSVLRQIHQLLREGRLSKTYTALVQGEWPGDIKKVDAPLHKNQLSSGERIVRVDETEGKPALTLFRVIKRFSHATLMECKPHTGRTHQIRVHTLHAGHPIAGDEKYGDREFNKLMRARGCKRLFLHAARIKFVLPETGQVIDVQAPLEPDLQKCLSDI